MYYQELSLLHKSVLEYNDTEHNAAQIEAWLVILPVELGSSIVSTVALNRLLSHCNRCRIPLQIACLPNLTPLYSMILGVEKVWGIGSDVSFPEFDKKYDVVLDFCGTATTITLCGRLQVNQRYATRLQENPTAQKKSPIGSSGPSGGPVFQVGGIGVSGDPDQPAWLLEAEVAARALKENIWEWKRQGEEPRLSFTARAIDLLSECGHFDKPYVVFAPCGGGRAKHWPLENWLTLLNLFIQRNTERDIHILLGPLEDNYKNVFKHAISSVTQGDQQRCFLHHSNNINETASLAWNTNLFITHDCGPMHLAAALGKPVLGIFGPTNPLCWFCYSKPHCRYIQVECSKFNKWGILGEMLEQPWPCWPSPEQVFSVASEILELSL